MNEQPSSDELDILDLLAGFFTLIQKNLLLIVIGVIVGIAAGVAYSLNSPVQYTSRLLFSTYMPEAFGRTQVEKLQFLIDDQNPILKEELNLSDEEVKKLVRVKIENSYVRKFEIQTIDGKETVEENIVLLQVRSTDNTIWTKLTPGLIHYLEHSPFVSKQMEQKKNYYTQVIAQIEIEIKDLEILKTKILNGNFANANTKEGMVLIDPTSINGKIISLIKEKIDCQNKLEKLSIIQIIEEFTVFNHPSNPGMIIYIAIGIITGLVISAVIILLKAVVQRVYSPQQKIGTV